MNFRELLYKQIQKWRAIGIVLVVVLLATSKLKTEYSFQSDSLAKLLQTYSLFHSGYQSQEYIYFFRPLDPNFEFFFFKNSIYLLEIQDKYIGPFPVAFSYITSWFFYLPYQFFTIFSGWLLVGFLLYFRSQWRIRDSIIIFLGLGSSFFLYGLEYSENIYFNFLVLLSITFFFKSKKFFFLSPLFLALSCALRLEALFFLISFNLSYFIFYVIQTKKKNVFLKLFVFDLLFLIFVAQFFLYNHFQYGNYLGPRFLADQGGFWNFQTKIDNYVSLYFAIPTDFKFKLGSLVYSPILLVFIGLSFWKSSTKSLKIKFFSLLTLIFFLLVPFFSPHDGFYFWGARYLSLSLISGALLIEYWLRKNKKILSRARFTIIYYTLIVYSCGLTILGYKFLQYSFKMMESVQRVTSIIQSDIVIFDNYEMALFTGRQLIDKRTLLIRKEEHLSKLIDCLKNLPKSKIALVHSELAQSMIKQTKTKELLDAMLYILGDDFIYLYKQIKTKELLDATDFTEEASTFTDNAQFAAWKNNPWKNRRQDYEDLKNKIAESKLDVIEKSFPNFDKIKEEFSNQFIALEAEKNQNLFGIEVHYFLTKAK